MTRKPSTTNMHRQIERLERLLTAERERAEKAWNAYRETLYENVEMKLKLDAVARALNGESE
jgi:hypothetical protein